MEMSLSLSTCCVDTPPPLSPFLDLRFQNFPMAAVIYLSIIAERQLDESQPPE